MLQLKDLSNVSEKCISLVYREYLREVNVIVATTLFDLGRQCKEDPEKSISFLSSYVGKIKTAAEMLDEIASGVVQVKKHQILLAATNTASQILEKHDNE